VHKLYLYITQLNKYSFECAVWQLHHQTNASNLICICDRWVARVSLFGCWVIVFRLRILLTFCRRWCCHVSWDALHPEAVGRVSDGHCWLQCPVLIGVRPEGYI